MAAEDVFGIVGTTQAGNFHIERVVAEGGFGVVYRALHGGFRAPVAIKCLKIPDQMTKQARDVFLEKFREEAELMFRLSGAITEVCRPLHVDVLLLADGRFVPFLAMEWLEGESLDAIVTRRREQGQPPLGLHKVIKMLRPVAMALHKAHRFPGPQGAVAIIHRDLKPENLMVATIAGVESMKILDFGIAKAKRAATQAVGRLTGRAIAEDEMASFTPAYGAPEQWVPKSWGETGPWTDVWGLALTMVEALTGAPPIDGEPWVMRRICLDEKRRPTPRTQGTEVPAEVEKVFEQALALDPRQRYKTIESFWTDLETAMGLVPTLGKRDDRREPGAHSGEEDPRPARERPAASLGDARERPPTGPVATGGRVELARINLQAAARPVKAPVAAEPARPAAQVAIADAPKAQASAMGEPPPPQASGSWEFDLTGTPAVDAGCAPKPPPAADPEVKLPAPEPLRKSDPKPVETSPAAASPPIRHHSGELELELPTRSDPPPPSASLEMSLPTGSDPPPPPEPAPAPHAAPQARRPLGAARPRSAEQDGRPPAAAHGAKAQAHATAPTEPPLDFDLEMPARRDSVAQVPEPIEPASPAPAFRLPAGSAQVTPGPQRRPVITSAPPSTREARSVGERLRAPLGILLAAILVATLDLGYQRLGGGQLALGPVRPFWIAAPLAIFGVGLMLWRMMEGHGDE